jgi:hypothetical protein
VSITDKGTLTIDRVVNKFDNTLLDLINFNNIALPEKLPNLIKNAS